MPALCGLLGVLAYNYRRHLHGLPTICATFRRYIPRWAVIPFACTLCGWLIPHLRNGYPKEIR